MDTKELSAFIRQLTDNHFDEKTIVLDSKTISLNLNQLHVDILDPLTKNVLYTFLPLESKPSKPNPPAKTKEAERGSIAAPTGEPPVSAFDSRKPKPFRFLNFLKHKNSDLLQKKRRTALLTYCVLAQKSKDSSGYTFQLYQTANRKKTVEKSNQPISIADLLPVNVLINSRQTEETHRRLDAFRFLCLAVAVIIALLTLLNAAKIVTLSDMQYAMIGVALLFLILPHTKALKLFGIEFERYIPTGASNDLTKASAEKTDTDSASGSAESVSASGKTVQDSTLGSITLEKLI